MKNYDEVAFCTKCKTEKPRSSFVKDRGRPNGLYAWCKDCTKQIVAERRQRESIEAPSEQKCNRCHVVKPLTEEHFGRCKSNIHGFQYECHICRRQRRKGWHQKDPEKFRSYRETRLDRERANGGKKIPLSQIFEASDGTCGICGDVVDPDLKWPDPMSPSRDHIVPLVAGGPNSMDNIQLAHLRCNLRKGHRD